MADWSHVFIEVGRSLISHLSSHMSSHTECLKPKANH